MKTSRRKFINSAIKATVVSTVGLPFIFKSAQAGNRRFEFHEDESAQGTALQFSQIKLPYAFNALEPHIDAMTMEIHYTKHHTAYIKNVNEAIVAEGISYNNEKDFFSNASKVSAKARNNAGGAWNHNFFWQIMKPNGGGAPTGKIADAINASFGSFDKFKEQFSQAGITRFGSGWAWLVSDNGKLKIGSTPNQDNPLMDLSNGQAGVADLRGTPLLALDVWEHAYYLKYQNKRADYVANWWNVVNWDEVAKRLI
jgi:superoxide dismutase, Fe-Mn family